MLICCLIQDSDKSEDGEEEAKDEPEEEEEEEEEEEMVDPKEKLEEGESIHFFEDLGHIQMDCEH